MAVSSLSAISAALPLEFDKKLSRQWNRKARLLSLLDVRSVGGKSVNFDVSFSSKTAASYAEGADVVSGDYSIDPKQPAILSWGLYRKAFGLTSHQIEAAASSNAVAQELADLFGESMMESNADLISKLNADAFSGDGTGTSLLGLSSALLADGNSYAGISRTTYPEWKSTTNTSASLATLADMRAMEASIFTACNERPNVIVTTPAIINKYAALFDTTRRLVNDVRNFDIAADPTDMLFFEGIPVIRDKDCQDGYMYMLNTEGIYLAAMPPVAARDAVIFEVKSGVNSNGESDTDGVGLPIRVEALAKTGDSVKFSLRTTLQLVVRRPNMHGVLSGIT